MATDVTTRTASGGRGTAFRVLAVIGGLVLTGFSALFLVLTFTDPEQEIHALHNTVGFSSYAVLMGIPLFVVARDPSGTIAVFRVVLAAALAALVAGVLGQAVESSAITALVTALLLVLHPARADVLRLGTPDVALLAVPVVATVPSVVYGLGQADLQASRPESDPHAEFEHYAGMATAAFAFVLAGAAAAFGGPAARLARWFVGIGAALTAALFLAYPEHVGAVDPAWAVAGLALAVVYLTVGEISARRAAT
jgi:hypothetical protein